VLSFPKSFGLTDWVRSVCDELAENGVIAIAPDLHSGQKFEDLDARGKRLPLWPKEQVKADSTRRPIFALTKIPAGTERSQSADFLGRRMDVSVREHQSETQSGLFVLRNPVDNAEDAPRCVSGLGFYAEKDERVNAGIPKAEKNNESAGKKYEPVIYKGATHGFMREGDITTRLSRNKKARDDAWVALENTAFQARIVVVNGDR